MKVSVQKPPSPYQKNGKTVFLCIYGATSSLPDHSCNITQYVVYLCFKIVIILYKCISHVNNNCRAGKTNYTKHYIKYSNSFYYYSSLCSFKPRHLQVFFSKVSICIGTFVINLLKWQSLSLDYRFLMFILLNHYMLIEFVWYLHDNKWLVNQSNAFKHPMLCLQR